MKADQLRKIYWRIEDDIKRRKLREELYFKVSKNYPHFLIIEGDDFISENRHIRSEVEPVNLDLLRILNDQTTLATAVIGNSRCSIDEKIKSLNYSREKGTCWSLEDPKFKSDRGMKRLAVISIEGSKNLAEMSDGYGIPYFEINPTRFRDDINNTVSDIITALQEEK
ncbi:MAG: hypothetical protein JJU46_05135 [Balneolaceae bacterium]|nr:hypothetical protein [Balneolaceae bacterium]